MTGGTSYGMIIDIKNIKDIEGHTSFDSYLLTSFQKNSHTARVAIPRQCLSIIGSLSTTIKKQRNKYKNLYPERDITNKLCNIRLAVVSTINQVLVI